MSTQLDPAEGTPNPGDADAKPAAPGVTPTASESDDSSQLDIETLPPKVREEIKALRAEARDRRLKARQAETEAKTQRENQLAEQQKWQELADERALEIGTLKTKAEQFDELEVLFSKQYQDEIKGWPADLLEMAPAADAPITTRLAWLEKARPMAKKLLGNDGTANKAAPVGGNRRGPEPTQSSSQHPVTARSQTDNEPLVNTRSKF